MAETIKTAALDFEMFNTKYYWSICWAGVVEADGQLNPVRIFDQIVNPGVREKFIGKTMTLPFSAKDLQRYPTFDKVAAEVFTPLAGALVIGHALENDLKMIADVCKKYDLPVPEFDYIDTNVCYNAVKNQATEHSLTALCDEFEIAFEAHDPSEDARAALAVVQKLSEGKLAEFLEKNGIVRGRFCGGLIRRTYFEGMPEKQKTRVMNYNAVFDAAQRKGQGKGKSYYLNNAVVLENDLTAVAEAILTSGGRLATDSFTADVTVTNDLTLAKTDYEWQSLKDVVARLGLDVWAYDYTPKKVTDADGKAISMTEYLSRIYAQSAHEGVLSGTTLCFCKSAERRPDFFEVFKRVMEAGGTVTARMDKDIVFVVNKLSDLNEDWSDGRIIAYKKSGANRKVMTLKELLAKI